MPSKKTSKKSSTSSKKTSAPAQKTSLSQRVKAVAGKLTTGQKAAIGAAVLASIAGAGAAGYGTYRYLKNNHRMFQSQPQSQPFFNSTNTKEAWAHQMFK